MTFMVDDHRQLRAIHSEWVLQDTVIEGGGVDDTGFTSRRVPTGTDGSSGGLPLGGGARGESGDRDERGDGVDRAELQALAARSAARRGRVNHISEILWFDSVRQAMV